MRKNYYGLAERIKMIRCCLWILFKFWMMFTYDVRRNAQKIESLKVLWTRIQKTNL